MGCWLWGWGWRVGVGNFLLFVGKFILAFLEGARLVLGVSWGLILDGVIVFVRDFLPKGSFLIGLGAYWAFVRWKNG